MTTTTPEADNYPGLGAASYALALLFVAYILSFVDRQILSLLVGPIREKVDHLVLIGASAGRMAEAFAGLAQIHQAGDMHEAVAVAARSSRPGGVVLLSPGCSSFDMFKSYEQRGQVFEREFRALSMSAGAGHGN